MWNALKHRNYRLLWFGQIVSALGDQAYQIALSWFVASNFGTVSAMAMVQLSTSVPTTITRPLSGSFIDKYTPRQVMLWLNLVMGISMAVFAYTTRSHGIELWMLISFTAFFGIFGASLEPAFFTAIPRATGNQDLESANSLVMFLYSAAGLLGPLLSVVFIGHFGTTVSFGFNALSFYVAALLALLISIPGNTSTKSTKRMPKTKEAWVWLKDNPWGMRMLASEALVNFVLGFFWVSLPILLRTTLKVNIVGFGGVYSFVFLGSIVSTVVSGYFLKKIKDRGLLAYVSLLVMMGSLIALLF